MTDLLLDIMHVIGAAMVIIGSLASFIGGLGVVRMPEFYTRLHAASVTDTMGAGGVLLGLCLLAPDHIVALKLIFILLFLFFTSPIAGHAIAKAAWLSGQKPGVGKIDENVQQEEEHISLASEIHHKQAGE